MHTTTEHEKLENHWTIIIIDHCENEIKKTLEDPESLYDLDRDILLQKYGYILHELSNPHFTKDIFGDFGNHDDPTHPEVVVKSIALENARLNFKAILGEVQRGEFFNEENDIFA